MNAMTNGYPFVFQMIDKCENDELCYRKLSIICFINLLIF